jgi:5-methylcytosine-specific restriction endonuclease McrA
MTSVLVLNSAFIPIRTISDRDAIVALWQNKAYTVVETEKVMRSPSLTFRVPSVIALLHYGEFPRMKVAFSKLNIIYRDDQVCQYCGKRFPIDQLTVDHVIPISRWPKEKRTHKKNWTNWFNCVCSCKWCNNAKGNHLLYEIGWKLKREPYEPKYLPSIIVSYDRAEAMGWLPFAKMNIRLIFTT